MKFTRLGELVRRGDIDKISEVLASNPEEIDKRDSEGRTALMEATCGNKVGIVRMLLDAGADTNIQDKRGYTALHFAAQNYCPEIAEMLLSAGADIDVRDVFGNTPLSRAVFDSRDRGEIIAMLLKLGADMNVQNNYGVSPLSLAKSIANYNALQFFPEEDRE